MPRLLNTKHVLKILKKNGFEIISQKGSHVKLRKLAFGIKLTAIVPSHNKEMPFGTFMSICEQSKLEKEIFE